MIRLRADKSDALLNKRVTFWGRESAIRPLRLRLTPYAASKQSSIPTVAQGVRSVLNCEKENVPASSHIIIQSIHAVLTMSVRQRATDDVLLP
jgi:hypothetical protein